MKKLIFTAVLLFSAFAARAQFIPDVPNISLNPADSTINIFAPSTQVWSPIGKLQVKASGVNAKIQLYQNSSGNASLVPNIAGLEMFAGAMNNSTNIYTPFIKFGSNDSDFGVPTGRMRFLAGIGGIATESYTSTSSGGMGLDVVVSKNAPGVAATPTVAMQIRFTGTTFFGAESMPNLSLTNISGGTPGTDSLLAKTSTNTLVKIAANTYLRFGDTTSFLNTLMHINGTEIVKGLKIFSPVTTNAATAPGIVLQPLALATAVNTQFYSGSLDFNSYGYNSTTLVNNVNKYRLFNQASGGNSNAPDGTLVFQYITNSGSATQIGYWSHNSAFTSYTGVTAIGQIFAEQDAVGTNASSFKSFVNANMTLSTSGVPNQYSGVWLSQGNVWDLTAGANKAANFGIQLKTTSGLVPTMRLAFSAGLGTSTLGEVGSIDMYGILALPLSAGQTTLTAGVSTISITGLTSSSKAQVTLVSPGGTVSTTWQYKAVCTAGTLTITAVTNTGTTDTTDTSILNYVVTN